jgi:prepilin-type N-terminal cleavage/methylation domain-containing protein
MSFWRDERGFTLAELLVALSMLVFVLTAIVMIENGGLQAYVVGSNKTEVQQNARVALERMARQIREATTGLTATDPTSLSFTLPDPVTGVPIPGVAVTYALAGNALTCTGLCDDRTVSAQPVTVIGAVTALTFVYRGTNDVPGAILANVRRVDITIQTASEGTVVAGGVSDARAELTTSVRLRNL